MENIIFGKIRVQLLSDEIVRIEYARRGKFCDENTFFAPNRTEFKGQVNYTLENGVLCFGEYELYLPENSRSLTGVRLEKNGKTVYRYKRLKNSGELPELHKTPEVFALSDTPRIIVPNGGYSKNRDGQYRVEENVQDVYLFLCERDAKKLRALYVSLTGAPEFVRLATLGSWNSKYYAYTEKEAKQVILDFEKNGVPLDNIVIDTDWRSCEHGWGYDINTKLFPNMKRFLDFAHAHNVEVMFNDHPEPQNGLNVFRTKEIAYRERNLQSLMQKGLDTWWYDRNWMTSLISPSKEIAHETLGLYLFSDITKHFYQKQAGNNEIYRRPVVMGNAVHIANGNYAGISDSASHRYSIQWTGDIGSDLSVLGKEVESLIKAGNNEIVYINADCGGHWGNPQKEEFIRWMQFGTLSPVFRPHCNNIVERTREPWVFDEETLDIVREYNKLRYRLLPLIYKSAHEAYECGTPIFRSLGWNYPADKNAVKCKTAYMLGDDILIRPVSEEPYPKLEAKHYVKPVKATYYNGMKLEGEPIATGKYEKLDMMLDQASPEKNVPMYNFSARFETEIRFDKDVELIIATDDGSTVYLDGKKVIEDESLHSLVLSSLGVIEGGKSHKLVVEYFQAGGEACCVLFYNDKLDNSNSTDADEVKIYLPKGRWLDVFDGKIYQGGKTVSKQYGLREMPLFVRLGALLPLAYSAQTTKEQSWARLVLDYYPDKGASDSGYLYEDDGETTAYKLGHYRKTPYSARYNESANAFVINIGKAEGNFEGERCVTTREYMLKCHVPSGADIACVSVNGRSVDFEVNARNRAAFPISTEKASPDTRTVTCSFESKTDESVEIVIELK